MLATLGHPDSGVEAGERASFQIKTGRQGETPLAPRRKGEKFVSCQRYKIPSRGGEERNDAGGSPSTGFKHKKGEVP